MNKVSVAIPAYNQPDNLRECLRSIANQTIVNQLEVLVFDDNGPSSLEGVISEFPSLNIIYKKNETRLGSAGNISQVFNHPYKTPYIVVFHHDDVMHPRMLEEQVKVFEDKRKILWVGTAFKFSDSSQMLDFDFSVKRPTEDVFYAGHQELTRALLSGIKLAFGSVMYRREALGVAGFETRRFGIMSDRPYLVELAMRGPVAFIKNELMNYRIHLNQDSRTGVDTGIRQGVELMKFYKEQLPQPLSWRDKRLFYVCSTNNLLDSYLRLGEDRPTFRKYIRDMQENGIMSLWYLNRIGLRSIFRNFLSVIGLSKD